ncbi:MAG: hypothetical protein WA734_17345, partial [Candidatus Acidiferrales bacterium]
MGRFQQHLLAAKLVAAASVLLLACAGCKHVRYIDIKPLDQVGMDYSAIQDIKGLSPSDAEIAEVAKAKMGGLSDHACIELLRISRTQ